MTRHTQSRVRKLAWQFSPVVALLCGCAVEARLIIDTGPGNAVGNPNGYPNVDATNCDCYGHGLSAGFKLSASATLSEIQVWMRWFDARNWASPPFPNGRLKISISANDGVTPLYGDGFEVIGYEYGMPGTQLYEGVYAMPGTTHAPRWEHFDLSLMLAAGIYWINVQDTWDEDSFVGEVVGGAPQPMMDYAHYLDAEGYRIWHRDPLASWGFRISAIPEPQAWLTMPLGLALLALRRKRKTQQ